MVKTITVTEDAYLHLKELKNSNESFSQLIERLYEQKRKITLDEITGIINDQEATDLEKISKETRKNLADAFKKRATESGI